MLENKYFGIILTFAAFEIGKFIQSKFKTPLLNPLIVAISLVIAFLKLTGINYEFYKIGGDFIAFFIAPATVAMILDLYINFEVLKKNFIPVMVGIVLGSMFSMILAIFVTKIAGFDKRLMTSLVPQSITTAIAISLSEEYMGIGALTAIVVVVRGITGAVVGRFITKSFKITDPVAQGVAIGTASHAMGTSEARKMGEVQGAFSGLSIAVAGLVTVFLMPVAMIIVNAIS